MKVDTVGKTDIKNWLKLAGEVEKLFGPMREEADFLVALEVAIGEERAFCIRDGEAGLIAAIALSYEKNEIEWLAVASSRQKSGLGGQLLQHALQKLDSARNISVQTFADSTVAFDSARNLYMKYGFKEFRPAGLNPAGIATVIMVRSLT